MDDSAPRPRLFAHVVFRTSRYEAMQRWWSLVLQARVAFANRMIAFLTYDDEHHRVAIANVPALEDRPEGTAGLEHVAYTYASLKDLLTTYVRLKREGIVPYWCINHGPTTSMYYRDPDGNQVELQVDNFPDVASLNAWLQTDAFRRNPIGVNYDPEDLLARFEAGEPEALLLRRGDA